ncbi:hypothetical protein DFQ26_003345 [Actinomortierella ambigua]|nr:hypothetical protein DFQ26_003345 [Actinomortierella ambigua]
MTDNDGIENEIQLLARLQYRHIIQFYGVVRQPDAILLITDFAELGSLKRRIDMARLVTWTEKSRIAQQIAQGLAYIHHEGILHRDLKSANVLLTVNMDVKLCDFGLAAVKALRVAQSADTFRGTVRWMAPELLGDTPQYSTKSDIYALGMIMWEMAAMCTTPFDEVKSNPAVARAVHRGRCERLPDTVPANYQQWIKRCWEKDPSKRPEARELALIGRIQSTQWNTSVVGTMMSVTETMASTMRHMAAASALSLVKPANALASEALSPNIVNDSRQYYSDTRDDERGDGVDVTRPAESVYQDPRTQLELGLLYAIGRGIEQSDTVACKWFTRAANQGLPEAQFYLGTMYSQGRGVVKSDIEAAKWFTMAADQGDSHAQFNLGNMYESGQGVKQNNVDAIKWYIEAANQDHPAAQFHLGLLYFEGRGVRQSDVEAVKWYTTAANQDHPAAQFHLGLMYLEGRCVNQSDVEAVKWFNKAANQDHAAAQFNLGNMYRDGRGVSQSDIEAVKWFSESANQDHPAAQFYLGLIYFEGRGVNQSDIEAVKWFIKAANQGHPTAQVYLEDVYSGDQGKQFIGD